MGVILNKHITEYEPKNLWKYFSSISDIPRESGNEKRAVDYLENLAKEKGYEYHRDKTGNIVIKVPATKGMKNAPTVILQAHIDMVCVKSPDCNHDFTKDGIHLVVDGEWLTAKDTTLGADNLIGVAAALGIVEESDMDHPTIEIVVTVDEEAGMTGAINLDTSILNGRILINLDSMDAGVFYIGCAGGGDCIIELPIKRSEISDGFPVELRISGLAGGHSGLEILKGSANAIKLTNRILFEMLDQNLKLVSIDGGTKRNVIPSECIARFVIPSDALDKFKSVLITNIKGFFEEFADTDPDAAVELNGVKVSSGFALPMEDIRIPSNTDYQNGSFLDSFRNAMTIEDSRITVQLMTALPHGILAMSTEVDNLVETSNNMGVVKTQSNKVEITCTHRSSVNSAKLAARSQIIAVAKLAEADVRVEHDYPGWKPNLDSPILKLAQVAHEELFGNLGTPRAVHAGLETGLLLEKIPNLDIISFGPDIKGAHSVDEKVHIGSVESFYKLLKVILSRINSK